MKLNFGQYMLQVAKRFSDKEALVNTERNRRYTFMELHLLTNKMCNMMRDRFGMGEGDRYMAWLENDNMCFSHYLMKGAYAGAWSNYRDAMSEHLWHADHLKPRLVLLEKAIVDQYYDELRKRNIEIICMDRPDEEREGVHYMWDLLEDASDAETGVEYDIDDHIVLYRFTGGTTGKGKCAMYTAGNLLAGMQQFFGHPDNLIGNADRFLSAVPLSHGSSPWPLPLYFKGATMLTQNIPDLEAMGKTIEKERVTSTVLVPTLLYRLVEQKLTDKYDFSSLQTMFYGSAAMSPGKLLVLKEELGDIFVQVYGATEAFPGLTFLGKSEHAVKESGDLGCLKSIGQPTPGIEIRIRDDDGKDLPPGEIGEIWLRTRSVIKGYYKNPEQTEKEFQDGFWKSGDMAYQDEEGYTYIVDRKKDMIITGGFNVYATEVEAVIIAHPCVSIAAVIGIPHEEWGEAVHAVVVKREGSDVTEQELRDYCREKIGSYKTPKSISFVDELPVTPVGKVLRRKIKEPFWEGTGRKI